MNPELATLREITANLQSYVEARAAELAQPRIAEAERQAVERVAAAEQELTWERQRREDLVAELRRQIRVLERERGRQAVGGAQ